MNIALENLKHAVLKIKDRATEPSYYPALCKFLEEFETQQFKKRKDLIVTPLESSTLIGREIGFPDLTVRHGQSLIGWIEVKLPKESLNSERFKSQFKKYRDSLENIIFTNFREWELWQWNERGEAVKTSEVLFDITDFGLGEEKKLENFLIKFLEGKAYEARTPKQLALALAKKTKLLSQQVEEAFDGCDKDSDLFKLKETFERLFVESCG